MQQAPATLDENCLSARRRCNCHDIVIYFDYSTNMEARDAAAGFAVLAQETRLKLVRLLASRGASGMAAGEVAAALKVAPSTLSFHPGGA